MVRRFTTLSLGFFAALVVAGCGGDSNAGVQENPPPPPAGPEVRGTVSMPNGVVALLEPNLLDRLDEKFVSVAHALYAPNVAPVGRNVEVSLLFRRDDGATQGNLGRTYTNDQGGYVGLHLPTGLTVGAPDGRFMVAVGSESNGTLTRAFVCNATSQQNTNIDYRSEAVVRVILGKLQATPSCKLSDFSPQEICDLLSRVYEMDTEITGNNAQQVNAAATAAVASDPLVLQMLNEDCNIFIPPTTRSATRTPQTPTVTPTRGEQTAVPTATRTNTPIATTQPSQTETPSTTRVPTPTPSVTPNTLAVNIGTGILNAQGAVSIPVYLVSGTATVGGVQNDMLFDNRIVNLASATACKINPAIGTNEPGCEEDPVVGPCKTLSRQLSVCGGTPQPPGCPEGAGPETSRFRGIIAATAVPNANSIPGGVLYTCDFTLQNAELLPAVLDNMNVVVANPLGDRIEGAIVGDGLATAGSSVARDLPAGATEIPLTDDANFPQSGSVQVRKQVIGFTLSGSALVLAEATDEPLAEGEIVYVVPDVIVPTATPTGTATQQPTSPPPTDTPVNTPIGATATPTTPGGGPTNTPVTPPTATNTPITPSPTPTIPFTSTPTSTPTSGPVEIDVGMVSGARGTVVDVPVTIQHGLGRVVATANDITYNRNNVRVKRNGDTPDCTIATDIAPGTSADKMLVAGIETDGNVERLRVGVVSFEMPDATIRDGLLFTCKFEIDLAAESGEVLLNVPSSSDADGDEVPTIGDNGSIGLSGSLPLIVIEGASGPAGGSVNVPVRLVTAGQTIAGVGVDIVYDSNLTNVGGTSAEPSCTIDASIGAGTTPNKVLVGEVVPLAGSLRRLRVGIFSYESPGAIIPMGPLFSCQFNIAAGASGSIGLDGGSMVADPAGVDIAADTADASIQVQ